MCIKRPVFYEYDIGTKRGVDLISVGHVDNTGSDCIELRLVQNGEQIDVSDSTVTACYVMRKTNCLVSDGVSCTVNESGNILVPFDHAAIQSQVGDMNIEISITNHKRTLTLPFPLWVRVRQSILDNAGVTPDTQGTVAELLERAKEALGRVEGYVNEKTVCKIVVEKIAGISAFSPELMADNIVDEQYNPNGDYIIYYFDSQNVRRNVFNISEVLYSKAEIDALIGGVENGAY